MFFKNLQLFRLPAPWALSAVALAEQLARGPFVKCPSNQPVSRGWLAPRDDEHLLYESMGQYLIVLGIEERLLPKAVIDREVRNRAALIEEQQGYAPGRKQLKELRERVTEELLPQAFVKQRRTPVWIDPQAGWLVVDASSAGKADEVIEHLRHCLDDFPLTLLHTQNSAQAAMADWLAGGEAPAGFTIDRDCELKATGEEKATVRYASHPLDGAEIESEIKAHLAAGKLPTKLALTWGERISFVLTEKHELKRLAFLDLLKESAEQANEDQFAADCVLMTAELSRLLPALVDILGGEVRDEQ